MIIGVDLGNKTRNSICVMQGEELLDWSRLNYSESESAWHHRKKIVQQIDEYIKKYKLTKDDYILFEEIAFYRGVSRMYNIVSMAFLQATLINEFSDRISISTVHVQSWKSKVLGNRSAKKEDAVAFIESKYPQVDLDIVVHHPKKGDEIIKDNDTADAICIGLYGSIADKKKLDEKLVNYT